METNYPTVKRPKRKLCYLSNKEKPSEQWAGKVSLEDVSKMFDDLDDDCDVLPPSLLLDIENKQGEIEAPAVPQEGHLTEKHPRCQMVPKEDVLHPAAGSASTKPDTDLDIPFVGHGPVQTSTPIEGDTGAEEQDNEKERAVSPILFLFVDKEKEEAKKEPLPIQKPQCNGHTAEESDDFDLESPSCKIVLSKPKSSQKMKVEASCKESHPGDEKSEGRSKTQRQENTDLPVPAMRQDPKQPASRKSSEIVHREPVAETSTRVGKEMSAFLQKLRDAGQPKPATSRKLPSPVNVPTCPPEPEDDFLILEDDTPFRFSIQSKNAKKKSQSKTSSTDKDSSTDKGMKDAFPELTQKQQEPDQANRKLQSQSVYQKKKKKVKKSENEVTETEKDMYEYIQPTPEDLPAVDLMEQDKPNQKKQQQLKKIRSKESDEAEDKPKDTTSRETDEENIPKPQRSSQVKRSKSSKYEKENAKTSKAKSFKWTKKEMQGSDGAKETVKEQRSSEEHADVEDLGSLSDKELWKSEAQTANVETKQNTPSGVSEGSSSGSDHVLGKRKRNPPGQWWLSCPESLEETKVTDNQPILKKSKPNPKKLRAEVSPLVKAKNDVLLKQRQHITNKKKIKLNKRRTTRGDNPDEMKATVQELQTIGSEQIGDQDVSDQDLNQSSPLVFQHRDHNFNSGHQIFQRVYHHSGSENMSSTSAAPVSPRRPSEHLRTPKQDKRRRKPPGTWWRVDNLSEDMEPKPHKERKPRSKQTRSDLWNSKKINSAVSSKPPGGAPVAATRRLSSPETDIRSLATFKDSVTSTTKTPAVLNNRDAGQKNTPAEDSATNCKTNKDILSMDADDLNLESPPARCHTPSTFFRSGPSSMIELEQYEENDDMVLPSSRVQSTLPMSDLCASPLKPLVLQAKDKANLAEWLKSLWPATVNNGAEITPDQFDWYFYQGRAIGFLQDLQCGSISNGKILLGSYTKKPLWVDHSANTVFNLLTSSVSVNIDCSETRFNPGQSFMVQCGHAYSIQNLASQPAVLCFTRILAESPA